MQVNEKKSCASATGSMDPHYWVKRYAEYLHDFAIRRINHEDQAKDLVQDTFLSGLENIGNFKGLCTEKTWLTAILRNKIIDVYRKRSSGSITSKDIIKAEWEHQDFFDISNGQPKVSNFPIIACLDEADPIVNKELAVGLQRCIQKLPTLWLSVFSMKYIDDRSTKSICNELKVTPSYCWTIIHRSKVSLQSSLKKMNFT